LKSARLLSDFDGFVSAFSLGLVTWLVLQEMLARWVWGASLSWTEDVSRILLIAIAYFGAAALVRDNRHINVSLLSERLSEQSRAVLSILSDCVCLIFSLFAIFLGFQLSRETAAFGIGFTHSNLQLPLWAAQLIIPISFLFTAHHLTRRLLRKLVPSTDTAKGDRK
jgi:C4-dicarboxylate transporter DctQ subunit